MIKESKGRQIFTLDKENIKFLNDFSEMCGNSKSAMVNEMISECRKNYETLGLDNGSLSIYNLFSTLMNNQNEILEKLERIKDDERVTKWVQGR